jgi:hypothetical protein
MDFLNLAANAILNDWDCYELGGVLLSMKIAPSLVKILVDNCVSGMMVAKGWSGDAANDDYNTWCARGISGCLVVFMSICACERVNVQCTEGSTFTVVDGCFCKVCPYGGRSLAGRRA